MYIDQLDSQGKVYKAKAGTELDGWNRTDREADWHIRTHKEGEGPGAQYMFTIEKSPLGSESDGITLEDASYDTLTKFAHSLGMELNGAPYEHQDN